MENEYKWCVYKHTSPSGKYYIDITSRSPYRRWGLGSQYSKKSIFYKAIQKYGWDNIKHEVLISNVGEKTAKNIEKDLIKFAKIKGLSYNITDGGDGTVGLKHTAEFKETKRKSMLGNTFGYLVKHRGNAKIPKGANSSLSKTVYQYDLNGNFLKKWDCITDFIRSIGRRRSSLTHISACCKGKRNSAYGYIWRYYKQDNIEVKLSNQTLGAIKKYAKMHPKNTTTKTK